MYTLIEHKKLDTAAASITFSSIPATFTDLYLVHSLRTNNAVNDENALLRINGDSTSNYVYRFLRGNGSSVGTGTATITSVLAGRVNGTSSTASTFSSTSIYIPNYTSSAQKSISIDSVSENNATFGFQIITSVLWQNTSAITTLVLSAEGAQNLLTGSSATLYGINRTSAIGAPKAIGGNITYANGYWVHTFTGSGTFYAQEDLDLEYVVVAGGGGGGNVRGGGGGAGGYRSYIAGELSGGGIVGTLAVSAKSGQSLPVQVGAGGSQNVSGSPSALDSVTALGGGNGANAFALQASVGGSGGGGSGGTSWSAGALGTTGQGFAGQAGTPSSSDPAGGGGGAGGLGSATSSGGNGGTGGIGVQSTITGAGTYLSGGGGGSQYFASPGAGGLGGGGNGDGRTGSNATSGQANTGGGGGGGNTSYDAAKVAGNGGSGVVIVRYRAD
jgi:hypothetical protein